MRKKIAIDIDEVIVPLAEPVIEYVLGASGKRVTAVELYSPPGRTMASGLPEEEFIRLVLEYQLHESSLDVGPVDGVLENLSRLSKTHDIIFVTSRDPQLETITHRWFDRHMQGLPFDRNIVFVGNPYTGSENKGKIDVCKELGAEWFIDDHPKYVDQLIGSSVRGMLFGDYDWNRHHAGDHFVRVVDWDGVVNAIKGRLV